MPHQGQHLLNPPALHHQDLRRALDWLSADADLSGTRLRGSCTWTPRGLICAALLWAWSDEPTLVARFRAARKIARLALGLDAEPAATYQAFLKLLRARTTALAALLILALRRRMRGDLADRFEVAGFAAFAVDGSRLQLPRTASNQASFTSKQGRGPKAKRRRRLSTSAAGDRLIKEFQAGYSVDNPRPGVCNRGRDARSPSTDPIAMATISQRIASAFAVLRGRYGEITAMAREREQSRQSLYRESEKVVEAVEGSVPQARIDELRRQLADSQAEVQSLHRRLKHAVEITRDVQDQFACVAQAEGVSLSVARRLLLVVAGSVLIPSIPTLGRATRRAGERAGPLLEVLDEAARPKVEQAAADEIFWPRSGPDVGRTREPLQDHRSAGRDARRGHLGSGVRPAAGAGGRGPRRRHRPG
jgi:hypothetical protein